MSTAETVVSSLRRSGALILKNIWLLGWAFLYSFVGPILILSGTGLPILYWWLKGRYFEPGMLFSDPLAFILGHGQLILFSLAGFTVGFTLYLLVVLFYQGALTGVVARGITPGGSSAEQVNAGLFWSEGAGMFGRSVGIATLASLLPLLPGIPLLVFAVILAFRIPDLISGGLGSAAPLIVIAVGGAVLTGVIAILLTWLAFIWYQLGMAAARVEGLLSGAALGRAWRFFTAHWKPVLGYVVALIVLTMLSWGVTAPFSVGGKWVQGWSAPLGMAMQIVGAPLSAVLSIFMDLWLKCALVVIFIDNRSLTVRAPAAHAPPVADIPNE